jgi:hypothetical protein
MRLYTSLILVCGLPALAATLDDQGWRRQEQSGTVAYFKGEEAMVMVVPPRRLSGDLRAAFAAGLRSYLGGSSITGGDIRESGGALLADYEVHEANGTRTFRTALAWARDGQMETLLFATNDRAAYDRHRPAAMAFFASRRAGEGAAPSAPGAVLGEWYTGSISTIQRKDSVTGALAPPSGNNMTYTFQADGTYQMYGLMQFTYASCVNS